MAERSMYQVMPALSADEYSELKADIAVHGVLVPVEYDDAGNILDGHHRVRACDELGITDWPRIVRLELSDDEKRAHARMLNLARRHLTQEQRRGLIREQLKDTPAVSNREVARTLGVDHKTVGDVRSALEDGGEIPHHETRIGADGVAQPARKPYRVVDDSSEGRQSLLESAKDAREAKSSEVKVERDRQRDEAFAIPPPTGQYRCIVVDPPWPVEKFERDVRPNQTGSLEYPTMTVVDIAAMTIPAHDESHMWLWTTQRFLPQAFAILEAWKFKYLVTMVWHKPGGPQPHGLPQYNAEFVLLGRRGGQPFADTKQFFTCFSAPRREHSRKPDEFYSLVSRVSPGPRLDMFSRELRDGFEQWGYEPERFSA